MKIDKKVYYFDYNEKINCLSIISDSYKSRDKKMAILSNTIIPKKMIYHSKRYIEWNKCVIEKLCQHSKKDKYFFYAPFATGMYKTVFDLFFFSIYQKLLSFLRIYIWGLIKLPFIPFYRYFENIKKKYDNNLKLKFLNKSKNFYEQLIEKDFPQDKKELLLYMSGKTIEDIKKEKQNKLSEVISNIGKLNKEKEKLIEEDTNLANMSFSLIIAVISMILALFSLKMTNSDNNQADDVTNKPQKIENTLNYTSKEIVEKTLDNPSIQIDYNQENDKNTSITTSIEQTLPQDISSSSTQITVSDDKQQKLLEIKTSLPAIILPNQNIEKEKQYPTFSEAK